MKTERNIEEAREFFKGDRFATENGMIIEELDGPQGSRGSSW